MSDTAVTIQEGCRVTLHFSLKLDDGQVVDSNFNSQPVTFTIGDGSLPAGFEQVILGLDPGDEGVYRIPPSRAFGMSNPANQQVFLRARFAADMALEEGLVVSFADAAHAELAGVVTSFDDQQVHIDFNHPLAGRELLFEVRVLQVENS